MVFLEDLIRIKNLEKKEYNVQQNLKVLLLNKYLIYKDKASLIYLLSREKNFTHSLLLNFDYDKEDRINESVMDSIYLDNKKYGTPYLFGQDLTDLIFVEKNKSGQDRLYIREGILKTIENITNENEGTYAIELMNDIR
jgi:hypothetical protein